MISPVKVWRNQKKTRDLLDKKGTIISYTNILVPPASFASQAPYVVAVVEFDDGKRYTAQLTDYDQKHLKTGQKIKTVLRRTMDVSAEGVIPYGVKFKPF